MVFIMPSARLTASDGFFFLLAMPNRYGSKPLDGQQFECMFFLLNISIDLPVLCPLSSARITIDVPYSEHDARLDDDPHCLSQSRTADTSNANQQRSASI